MHPLLRPSAPVVATPEPEAIVGGSHRGEAGQSARNVEKEGDAYWLATARKRINYLICYEKPAGTVYFN